MDLVPDGSLLDLIEKIRSWISWGNTDSKSISRGFEMMDENCATCSHCNKNIASSHLKETIFHFNSCDFCFKHHPQKSTVKVHPSESPRRSPDPQSPSFSSDVSFSNHPSPVSVRHSPTRTDEDDRENSTSHFFSSSREYFLNTCGVDSDSVSTRHEFYSFTDSPPSGIHITSNRVGRYVQQEPFDQEPAILEKPDHKGTRIFEKLPTQPPLDFDTNGPIWFPPPPDDESGNSFFTYDNEDDEEHQRVDQKEPLVGVVKGHFRTLVLHLLQGKGIKIDYGDDNWVDVIMGLAWQAANFIKPDTSRGGSMDPCDYVKVKCVASGNPRDSKLIKGIVCTKNIKHKRMTSQYKQTRLLLLGGALEYQRVPNQLASFDTLLQQENDHLKMIVSKIETHRPNVLLVEKSVSSFAQEQLLAKEISLVLNVKRPLLERIARCTGAIITPSTVHISKTRLGYCELFRVEKISEDHETVVNQFNKKTSKTLMFFEGCPRRLGCTVVLRGSSREELKKVKHVVQYAVFAAYHLSLETSFFADESSSLFPKTATKSSHLEKTGLDLGSGDLNLEHGLQESLSELGNIINYDDVCVPDEFRYRSALSDACEENLALDLDPNSTSPRIETQIQFDDAAAETLSECYSASNESQQPSILVSFSSHSMPNGTVCERSRLIRIKFYGTSDKPLGRYLRDDLFDQMSVCRCCNESSDSHVMCYTHQNGNLTINVRRLPSVNLPGKDYDKIWMWHRCLICERIDGVPPATRRVVISDAAWGLSFGKFLQISFANQENGNRVASCGHSMQRDCMRFYGFGSMVAFFQYSPINILSVRLPPSILDFCPGEQSWIRNEASELLSKAEVLFGNVISVLQEIDLKSLSSMHKFSDATDLHNHILELHNMIDKEKNYYKDSLQLSQNQVALDILELNRLRHSLVIGSKVWDRRLYLLDSLLKTSSIPNDASALVESNSPDTYSSSIGLDFFHEDNLSPHYPVDSNSVPECLQNNEREEIIREFEGNSVNVTSLERRPSAASILSDKIDSAWSGVDQKARFLETETVPSFKHINPSFKRLMMPPTRVYSFDSAQRVQERIRKGLLSNARSFQASGDYRHVVRGDPFSNHEDEKLNLGPSFISSASLLPEGARLMVPQNDTVIVVYDNEPTSIISYGLSSKEYEDWIFDKPNMNDGCSNSDLEDESKNSPHFRISFEDDDGDTAGKVKFSVTCYFAKQFDDLRRKCCPHEVDFVRSLSRCKKWSAQGGKSNVYFAKSFDERFIIKQVTKTELESFHEFAPEYFKYLTNSLASRSPTCLAKVLGIYQVSVKPPSKGVKEVKLDLMVMENLFFRRNISKVYDLKGSARSRYNSDTTGQNKVLLDTNLLETLRTNPIFLGSKGKRSMERAVWNDTSFLASSDVMDYSLLVGVDDDRKELVLGIIDFMRQYTWDKHLETWVKASGILGGPKNASPTIVSPKQYKKRFRKAMTNYFLTVPDQWSA